MLHHKAWCSKGIHSIFLFFSRHHFFFFFGFHLIFLSLYFFCLPFLSFSLQYHKHMCAYHGLDSRLSKNQRLTQTTLCLNNKTIIRRTTYSTRSTGQKKSKV
ncbi:hypothetical protein BDV33DRAFT_59023 [Aspergillus novoparasiticus]|uniref:Uncharacterized protein n=1 Tax=Aspergillus novoparasiticus TaxID=986946 RepID=A0A5N6EYJ1_9EURO|nr:hypothetical protein BDV33DRAFT_59023 [Aspergillus novoparasiticus]